MKKAHHIILAAALAAIAFNGVLAENKLPGNKKVAKSPPAATKSSTATQTTDSSNNEQKIAEMQKAIDQLRTEINSIKTARSELQVKLEQSDKDVAAQMMKVEDIKKKLTEKQKQAEALAKEKKR